MKFSQHFLKDVRPKRQYLNDELLIDVITNPIKFEIQTNGWIKLWGYPSE